MEKFWINTGALMQVEVKLKTQLDKEAVASTGNTLHTLWRSLGFS